ncbi:AAA family ATPase [Candidatus Gracilibacteria bacterium]|nr:AAA family ATPase [Candidatus Gracilibacteria bacterium]
MNSPKYSGNIILTGMPGSGKTNIGKKLAQELGINFCDFDDDVLEKITLSTAEEALGVLNLRKTGLIPENLSYKEVKKLLELLGDEKFLELEGFMGRNLNFESQTVLSTSGSLPLRLDAMEHLKNNGKVIYIDIPLELIISRLQEMKTDRIIGMGKMTLEEILQYRESYYFRSTDINFKVPTFDAKQGKTKEERESEKRIVFERFMEFYKANI